MLRNAIRLSITTSRLRNYLSSPGEATSVCGRAGAGMRREGGLREGRTGEEGKGCVKV